MLQPNIWYICTFCHPKWLPHTIWCKILTSLACLYISTRTRNAWAFRVNELKWSYFVQMVQYLGNKIKRKTKILHQMRNFWIQNIQFICSVGFDSKVNVVSSWFLNNLSHYPVNQRCDGCSEWPSRIVTSNRLTMYGGTSFFPF